MAAVVVVLCLLGCTGERVPEPSAAPGGSAVVTAARVDASGAAAPVLRAVLTGELEARVHLLDLGSAAQVAGRDDEVAGIDEALGQREEAAGRALAAVVGPTRARGVAGVLADQDELVLAHATPATASEERRLAARLPAAAGRLARVLEGMTGGRLPVDVAEPLATSNLVSLVAIADAHRAGSAVESAQAVHEALATGARMIEPLVLALVADVGLVGAPSGDAAQVRLMLTSAVVQHGFGAASSALGGGPSEASTGAAADRLSAVFAASYGADVGSEVRSLWVDGAAAAAEAVEAAVSVRQAATSAERIDARGEAALAEQRSDDAIAALATHLAGTVGDEDVEPATQEALVDHRERLIEAQAAQASGDAGAAWTVASDGAVELGDLAAVLAGSVTRQKSLG